MATGTVVLDRERTVRFTWLAAARLYREHQISLWRIEELDLEDPRNLGLVLWAGLLHEDPDLAADELLAMLRLRQLPQVVEAVAAALTDEFGGADADPFVETSDVSSTATTD